MGISKKLKMALTDKGISQKELAETVGISTQTIYNIFYRDNCTITTAQKFADAIGCEIVLRDKESGKIY